MTLVESRGLANRPGEPYPATFRMSVDPPRIEPGLPVCRTGVFPLDHEPVFSVDRMGIEPITPILQGSVASLGTCQPVSSEVRPGIGPGLPPYHGGVLPEHLQTVVSVIPDGIEPTDSWFKARHHYQQRRPRN